jgi:hypothetical protein
VAVFQSAMMSPAINGPGDAMSSGTAAMAARSDAERNDVMMFSPLKHSQRDALHPLRNKL